MKNDLLLKALRKEHVERPPVWMMRQAGRYLPEYMAIRKVHDFFTCVQTPELACEITIQPVDLIGVDAAIIFSDILVVPQAMGMTVEIEEKKGPVLPNKIETKRDVENLHTQNIESINYVFEAIKLTKKELQNRVPLIGFAGAPFTLLCYMVEGKGSKGFERAKAFCFAHPELAQNLLSKITQVTIEYLKNQVAAGADVVQLFDSWSGLLSPEDFSLFSEPYLIQIAQAISPHVPVILFPKGSNYALESLSHNQSVSGLGIDWTLQPEIARQITGNRLTLQGNFDPSKLLLTPSEIKKEVKRMISRFGEQRYIVNLGHGILPFIPVDHAKAFVEAVKEYKNEPVN